MKRFSVRPLVWTLLIGLALLLSMAVVYTFVEPPRAIDFDRLRNPATDTAWAGATAVAGTSGSLVLPEPTVVFRQSLDAFYGAAWSENGEFMALTSQQGDRDVLTVIRSTGDIVLQQPMAGLRAAPIFVAPEVMAVYTVNGATTQIVTVDRVAGTVTLRDLTGDCRDAAIYPVLTGQPGQLGLVGTSPNRDFTADTTHMFLADLASGECKLWQTYPEVQAASLVGWKDGRIALSLFRRPQTPDDPGHHDVAVFQVGGSSKPICLIEDRTQPILWSDQDLVVVRDASDMSHVDVWDVRTCVALGPVSIEPAAPSALAHDPTHGWLYVGDTDVAVLDDMTGAVVRRLAPSSRADGFVRSMTLAPGGDTLAVFVEEGQGVAGEFIVFDLRPK